MEYHRDFMDEDALLGTRVAVGGMWDYLGKFQLDFLIGKGLKPEHTLLDVGCGCLRGSLHFIRYLKKGHYWSSEISPNVLSVGQVYLRQAGLLDKDPHLTLTDDFGFEELVGQQFDFVQAFGVFTDMPPNSIRECFANLHKVLSIYGAFHATFVSDAKFVGDPVLIDFRYPLECFRDLCVPNGYSVKIVEPFDHPKNHTMIEVRRDPLSIYAHPCVPQR